MIEHLVLLAAREGQSAAVDDALERFVSRITDLDTVLEISFGTNFNEAGMARGWTHGMRVLVTERDDLAGYWAHPEHVLLAEMLDKTCLERFAVDYERTV